MKETTKYGAKVTVVIPCYNDGHFLKEAVQSILDQTYTDYRIIIVDDVSTEKETLVILKGYADNGIEVVRNDKNLGTGGSRNTGISLSDSPYALVLDSTDKFAPTFLEKAVAILDTHPKVGVVSCGVQSFGLEANYWLPKGGKVKDFLVRNNCCGNSLLRKRFWEDAGGYDINILYEDWDLWISGTSKGWEIYVIKEPLFLYRKVKDCRSIDDGPKKAAIYRQIVSKHKDVFCAYIEYVLFEKEMQLLTQYYSPTYRQYSRILSYLCKVKCFWLKLFRIRP